MALGAGVWGLAVAAIVRAVAAPAHRCAQHRLVLPSLRGWRRFGGLIKYGLRFQAASYTFQGREQGLNITFGAVGGVAPLGYLGFREPDLSAAVSRVQLALHRRLSGDVGFLARREDAAPVTSVPYAGRRSRRLRIPRLRRREPQLIPSVFGEQWRDATLIIPFTCLSTLVLGSIAVASTSYLSAAGRPGVVAWASAVARRRLAHRHAALPPVVGVVAIGIGNSLGALLEAAILDRATRQTSRGRAVPASLRPVVAVASSPAVPGWLLCTDGPAWYWRQRLQPAR